MPTRTRRVSQDESKRKDPLSSGSSVDLDQVARQADAMGEARLSPFEQALVGAIKRTRRKSVERDEAA